MKEELANRFYDLFLRFNRRLTFIIARLSPPLPLEESHVLGEIQHCPGISLVELVDIVTMDKSTLSRLISSLIERELVIAEQSEVDRRVKKLSLTPFGEEILSVDGQIRNQQVSECVNALNTRDQSNLRYFLGKMADASGSPSVQDGVGDSPLKMEIRRLTRTLGIISNDFLGSGFGVQHAQVMHLVFTNGQEMSMQDLRDMLPYEKTMFSRLVSGLSDDGLISKIPSELDKRQFNVRLTSQGAARAIEALRGGANRLAGFMSDLSAEEQISFAVILEKFLVQTRRVERVMAQDSISIDILKTPEERRVARGFLIENLVRLHAHYDAPEELLPRTSLCYAMYVGNSMRGVFELRKEGGGWNVLNFTVAPELLSGKLPLKLLGFGLNDALQKQELKSVQATEKFLIDILKPAIPGVVTGRAATLDLRQIRDLIRIGGGQ